MKRLISFTVRPFHSIIHLHNDRVYTSSLQVSLVYHGLPGVVVYKYVQLLSVFFGVLWEMQPINFHACWTPPGIDL